ncbi:MAG: DUF6919 domain-containing protein [Trebonia sp.]
MNRRDRREWKSARTLDDLGELVIRWLNGEIRQTPCHMGAPESETIPLIPALTVINRGGFITACSQLAETREEDAWNTWVDGFAADAVLDRLREAVASTPLILAACRRRVHGHDQSDNWTRCLWREETGFWAERCPAVADALHDCWFVSVEDPEPGRNGLLWDTLTRALAGEATA